MTGFSTFRGFSGNTGLWNGNAGLWDGFTGFFASDQATLSLNFLTGAPLDSRITFSRTTNATLVDATGRVTYAPNNLATYSQEPSNAAWNKTRASITADVMVAPDGTLTGDKLVEDTSVTNTHRTSVAAISMTAGTTYTWSIFLKAGERTSAVVALHSTSAGNAFGTNPLFFVDLLTGAITSVSASVTASSAVLITGGWWRVSVSATATLTTTNTPTVFLAEGGTNAYTGDGVSGLFLWGGQVEAVTYQTLPSTYVQTVASAYYGPRFDYNPVTLAPRGLLIEEQRTNLLLYSEQFDNAAWGKTRSGITANATTAPDGTASADKLNDDGVTVGVGYISQNVTYTNVTHTLSFYAKAGEVTSLSCYLVSGAGSIVAGTSATINLINGQVTVGSAIVTDAGNGWYRIAVSGVPAAGAGSVRILLPADTATTSGLFIWGAQLEAGAFATSYIPTVASTVTRAADDASMTGTNFSSWYNQSEGTIVSDFGPFFRTSGNPGVAQIDDGSANNTVRIFAGTVVSPVFNVNVGGVGQAFLNSGIINPNANTSIAGAYALDNFAKSANGNTPDTDASGTVPVVNRMLIGSGTAGVNYLNGYMRSITYYPTRLTNAQMQALTA